MRRALALAGMAALALMAQTPAADSALTNGTLLERDPQSSAGEFALRLADDQVLRYRYDARTTVESGGAPVEVPELNPGDRIEVTSERADDSPMRYARAVRVLAAAPHAPQRRVPTFVPAHHFSLDQERLIPRGDLTYAGVIGEIAGMRLVLHTRDAGEQTIVLRSDTRYLENGEIVTAGALRTNQRVYVRAGKNPYGQIEGYQVIWGTILDPGQR